MNGIYKCECGATFSREEAKSIKDRHGFEFGACDEMTVCPHCNSTEFKEAEYCEHCETYQIDVQNSICEKCLEKIANNIDYEQGLEYINHNKDLPMFVFEYIFDVKEPSEINELLMNEIKMMFQRKKVEDFLYNKPLLLNKIKEYVKADLWSFSDYLKEKGVI